MTPDQDPWAVGTVRTSTGRTVTDADLLNWAGLVHDFTRLHFDSEFMKDDPFGRPIAHGYIAMNLSVGLMFPTLANWYSPSGRDLTRGWSDVRFLAPVYVGDTLTCRRTIAAVASGNIEHFVEVFNQNMVVVMSGTELIESDDIQTIEREDPR